MSWVELGEAFFWFSVSAAIDAHEREIAAMVGSGLKNRQIAALLHKSERTVDNQVHSILNKLAFENRSQIAVWANQHGLIYHKADQELPP